MLIFLLKSTACLTIFLVFYKLMLERESVHHFKRYFLLAALVVSFVIPNLVFVEYIDTVGPTMSSLSPNMDGLIEQPVPQHSVFDWQLLFWMIYVLGVVGFGLRFLANLSRIRLRIKKHPKFKDNFVTKVLLSQSLPPHTFLNYIFLNQKQYKENSIPQQVLLHEETHAKQRHSLDIIFIELAQVVMWFNPLIYFFKSSIKLNHEFLADNAVIKKEQDHSQYQNTILSYLSNETYQSVGIANAINYSSIKKRFTVMKTNTSKKSFVLRSFLLLPLTALLLFGFSEHRQIERESSFDQIIEMDLLENGKVALGNKHFQFNEIPKMLRQNYLQNYDAKETKVEINSLRPVHYNTITHVSQGIRTTGIDAIEIFAEEVVMDKTQFEENIPITSKTTLLNANQMTLVGNELQSQQSATREEMKEYNALAKKYNDMDRDHMVIQKKEVMRLKEIYGKMSKKQRADAEPFPDFPSPPPAPPAPGATKPPMPPSAVKNVKETKPVAPPGPPAPPVPPKPVEHIKKMAAKGATFTLNGKEISGKKALEVVQKKQFISMLTMGANESNPVVELSTEPKVIDN
ncbi:M56 family metallopeptidase [Muricauda sp. NFXS6]|uniref:M56 family metallopeptidase n=1 Tax=Allomuricauda sp. NFXS6 TaxID=2819094 RepID=UPI0032DFD2D2